MRRIHLFYIQSNFHLIVSKGIIEKLGLSKNDVYYIVQRKITLPKESKVLFDESGKGFSERIRFYLRNRRILKEILGGNQVCAYFPFDFFFNTLKFYDSYSFYEEGLSSYATKQVDGGARRYISTILKTLMIILLFPFASSNIKGFLVESINTRQLPKKKTDLYICGDNAYNKINHQLVHKVVLPSYSSVHLSKINNSTILVLDRQSSQGRPYNLENYYEALKEMLSKYELNKTVYIKFHPADINDTGSKLIIEQLLKEFNYRISIFEGSLEDIAAANQNNTFVGSNSTILYYAPIFGNTNKSVSFVSLLAKRDDKYREFLKMWGGEDAFREMFSHNVECL